jgi:hypothetical protein
MYIAGELCLSFSPNLGGKEESERWKEKEVISHWQFQSPPFPFKIRMKSDRLSGLLHGAKNYRLLDK